MLLIVSGVHKLGVSVIKYTEVWKPYIYMNACEGSIRQRLLSLGCPFLEAGTDGGFNVFANIDNNTNIK